MPSFRPLVTQLSGAPGIAPYVSPNARHLIIFHLLTEGRAYARLPGGLTEKLTGGDIVVFPYGDPHLLGNGSSQKPIDSVRAFAKKLSQGLKLVRFGGGGEITRFVCGYMACEPRLSKMFLAGLPKMFKVPVGDHASGEWIENSIRFCVSETTGSHAGRGLVLARLSELLFVETLRRYINSLPAG